MRASRKTDSARSNDEFDPRETERLSRTLGRRYRLVLVSIAALVVLDQAVIQPLLVRLNFYAPVINVAGRQRMLSQKLTKAALAIESAERAEVAERRRAELSDALRQWTVAHRGLIEGSARLRIPRATSPNVLEEFRRVTPHFEAMRDAARRIASGRPRGDSEADRIADASPVEVLLRHEALYLPTMDRIVGLYEREAIRQVAWLRLLGLSAMSAVLMLLMGIGWFVIRPATSTIQTQIEQLTASRRRILQARDELEQRVESRTLELREANRSLQREIGERMIAEERTQQLTLQLTHASRVTAIGQLATGLAHEINQPLAAITNYAEATDLALEHPTRLDDARRAVGLIKRSALRTGHLVRSMRNFVRPHEAERVTVDLGDVIREVCELCQGEIADSDATLRLRIDHSLPRVAVDRVQIQQVLLNLIQNSLQAFQGNGRRTKSIELRCRADERELTIRVADSGPGFSTSDVECAFRPFFTTKEEGLGMGLAICRTIVRRHGGDLTAGNRATGGAVVRFTLPVAEEHGTSRLAETDRLCRR